MLQPNPENAKPVQGGKKISPYLFGLFFEDINYAADGGLYAELVQNRSFEYNPTERREWHPLSFWEYFSPGFSYGKISVETAAPVHPIIRYRAGRGACGMRRNIRASGVGLKIGLIML